MHPDDEREFVADALSDGDVATIQFLRSKLIDSVITEGRIAISTTDLRDSEAAEIERRYEALRRYLKKRYVNSILCWYNPNYPVAPAAKGRSANPSKPDREVWIGPHARQWLLADTTRCVKQWSTAIVAGRLV